MILGDFNVWFEVDNDSNSKKLKRIMNTYGLSQVINGSTHKASHTLDLVFLNESQLNF